MQNSSRFYTHLDMLSVKGANYYWLEGRFKRIGNPDATTSFKKQLEDLTEKHGRFISTNKHLFIQSLIHVSDFEDFWSKITNKPEYRGVFFLSNIANGTEVYHKLDAYGGFLGPYPWFRGNITLPIDKMMELGDEMVSYPKINREIKKFLQHYEEVAFAALNNERGQEDRGSSQYFDSRNTLRFERRQDYNFYPYFDSEPRDDKIHRRLARKMSSDPFTG